MGTVAVPFSCRLEDTTSGNTQQQEASISNWQSTDGKGVQQLSATSCNDKQLAAKGPKTRSPETSLNIP